MGLTRPQKISLPKLQCFGGEKKSVKHTTFTSKYPKGGPASHGGLYKRSIVPLAHRVMSIDNGSRVTEHMILNAWQQSLAGSGWTVIRAAVTKAIKGSEPLTDIIEQCCVI